MVDWNRLVPPKRHLWSQLWGCFHRSLTEEGRSSLNVLTTIPWALGPFNEYKEEEKQWKRDSFLHSFCIHINNHFCMLPIHGCKVISYSLLCCPCFDGLNSSELWSQNKTCLSSIGFWQGFGHSNKKSNQYRKLVESLLWLPYHTVCRHLGLIWVMSV